jgi:hypothetical protein
MVWPLRLKKKENLTIYLLLDKTVYANKIYQQSGMAGDKSEMAKVTSKFLPNVNLIHLINYSLQKSRIG